MGNLKDSEVNAKSSFAQRSVSFKLDSFEEATTDQMLMTRGGVNADRAPLATKSAIDGGGGGGAFGGDVVNGFNNLLGEYNRSAFGKAVNGAFDSVGNAFNAAGDFIGDNIGSVISTGIGFLNGTAGKILSSQPLGNGNRYIIRNDSIVDRTTNRGLGPVQN